MKHAAFQFEILTPAIAGGADPKHRAEIRPPSIRGQLRWWFRVLGGFKSQTGTLRSREMEIFGSVGKDNTHSSNLVVRIPNPPVSQTPQTMEELGAQPFSDAGYLLWPLRRKEDARPTIRPGLKFELQIIWKGNPTLWPEIKALITVFGHLGSLGFRGRRAMGALTLQTQLSLKSALGFFQSPEHISVKSLEANNGEHAIKQLGYWLKSWRAYGRTSERERAEKQMPGFKWASSDHDLGASLLFGNQQRPQQIFRAAIGLPLTQRFQGGSLDWKTSDAARFASPVLLRPYRSPSGSWHALVIFVLNHEMKEGSTVSAGRGRTVPVSLDLLKAMKMDPRLKDLD